MCMRLLVVAAGLLFITLCAADGADMTVKKATEIPAQPLAAALQRLTQEREIQLVYQAELVRNVLTPGVSGNLTAIETLTGLLDGTGLTYQYLDDKTITIVPLPNVSTNNAANQASQAIETNQSRDAALINQLRVAQAERSQTEGDVSAGKSSADSIPRSAVEEIVVTAQKRSERLQEVPISISVLTGDKLDRSSDRGVADALSRVPGVIGAISNAGARSNIVSAVVVRGVAPVPGAGGNGGTTGYYLDSIPFGFIRRSDAPDSSAYDLERVEVLRGPQGTLYGASALNGVVRILTKDANPNAFEFKVRTLGSATQDGAESYRGDLAVNAPLIKGKLAARAVIGYQNVGGWIDKPIKKDANDSEIGNYRLKLNAQPTDQLAIGLFAWLSRSEFGAPSVSFDNRTSQSLFDEPSSVDFDAYGLKVGYDFPGFTLTSMSSYLDFAAKSVVDFAPVASIVGTSFVYLNQTNASDVFSQEVVLNSTHQGRWRWSLGAIYRDAEEQLYQIRTDPRTGVICCSYLAPTDQRTYSESFAVFGELTRMFLDGRFELTGGVRYFEDKVSDREKSFMSIAGGIPAAGLATTDSKFDNLSPRVVVSWHANKQTTLYASYAEGFRSGLNQLPAVRRVAPAFGPVEPDELKSYEVGTKGSLWDGRIHFDTAAYYIDWQGVQQSLLVFVTPAVTNNALVNAGSASGPGAELGLTAELLDGLTLGANVSWNDLTVDSDIFTGTTLLYPKGSRLALSPERSISLSADYVFPLGASGFAGRISAGVTELPDMIVSRTNASSFSTSDELRNVRASFAVQSSNRWTATLFADNLGNEEGLTARDPLSPQWHTRMRPRTVGVQFEYRY